jgi:hypothetical protein
VSAPVSTEINGTEHSADRRSVLLGAAAAYAAGGRGVLGHRARKSGGEAALLLGQVK